MNTQKAKLYGLLKRHLEPEDYPESLDDLLRLCPRLALFQQGGGHWEAAVNRVVDTGSEKAPHYTGIGKGPDQETAVLEALLKHLERQAERKLDFVPRSTVTMC